MRPYVIINIAGSIDGKISDSARRQIRISDEDDLRRVDRLRAFSDGIMVGIGTVLSDDPSLTVKSKSLRYFRKIMGLEENPVRIVVDSRCRIPPDSTVLTHGEGKRILAVSERADKKKIKMLREKYPSLRIITAGNARVDFGVLMEKLWKAGIGKLLVEGGGEINYSLLQLGLVDEIRCFIGNIVIGGRDAPTMVDGDGFIDDFPEFGLSDIRRTEKGVILIWKKNP